MADHTPDQQPYSADAATGRRQVLTAHYGTTLNLEAVEPGDTTLHLWPVLNGVEQHGYTLHYDQAEELAAELLARAAVLRGQQGSDSGG